MMSIRRVPAPRAIWAALALVLAAPTCTPEVREFDPVGAGGGAASSSSISSAVSSGPGGGSASSSSGGGVCEPGAQAPCYRGPPGTLNLGVCRAGLMICNAEGTGYGPCAGEILPTTERCDTSADEDCNGISREECVYPRCADAPPGSMNGVYRLDPDGTGAEPELAVYCDLLADGGGWALVYSSIGSEAGTTLAFWNIPFAERLRTKGIPAPGENFYAAPLYRVGREYRDEIEDLAGDVRVGMRATAEGIDPSTMRMLRPRQTAGDADVFLLHFGSGWSSPDFDGDSYAAANCAIRYLNVTQHYHGCGVYNLGAGENNDAPFEDRGWGPHLATFMADRLGLAGDGTAYTRVRRISRWARW
jgi:hypothetical protein